MTSWTRVDLPEPETPVTTVTMSRGTSTSIPRRLLARQLTNLRVRLGLTGRREDLREVRSSPLR